MSAITDRIRSCCNQCAYSKIKCDSKRPICLNCRRRDRSCTYSYVRQSGRPRRARPVQDTATVNRGAVEQAEGNIRSLKSGQYEASLIIAETPSSPPTATVPTLPDSHFTDCGRITSIPQFNLAPEHTIAGFLDSFADSDMQHPISADYFTLEPMETGLSTNVSNVPQSQTREDTFMSTEQSSTETCQSEPPLSPSTDSHQLEQGLQNIFDDFRISSIVEGMINSPPQDKHLSCTTSLRNQHVHTTACDEFDEKQQCRCLTMLNKLYLIVMDPKLSRPNKALPFDLILFLEQALQTTLERAKQCKACGCSTLLSDNGVTICIVANWIANSIQVALETEIDISRKPSNSLWSYPERQTTGIYAMRKHNHESSTKPTVVPPSMDVRNTLWIGMWCVSSDAWILCMSKILARRIKRIQQMLSVVGEYDLNVSEMVNRRTTIRAQREMAKDIHIKAEILLGMVKNWVSECSL